MTTPLRVEPLSPIDIADAYAALADLDDSATLDALEPAVATTVVLAYQRRRHLSQLMVTGTAVERRRARRESAELDGLEAWLFAQIEPSVRRWVRRFTGRRFGGAWAVSVDDDMRAEAVVAAVEALASWDPSRGLAPMGWVLAAVRGRLQALAADPSGGAIEPQWRRVAAVAAVVLAELSAAGAGTPSLAELKDLVWERFVANRLASMPAADRAASGAREKAEGYLSRKSIRRAIYTDDLGEILRLLEPARSLDRTVGEDATTFGDQLAAATAETSDVDVVALMLDGLPALHRAVVTARFDDSRSATERSYAAVGEALGVNRHDVRDIVTHTQARLCAPHAQWARLAVGIEDQFDDELPGGGYSPAVVAELAGRVRHRVAA